MNVWERYLETKAGYTGYDILPGREYVPSVPTSMSLLSLFFPTKGDAANIYHGCKDVPAVPTSMFITSLLTTNENFLPKVTQWTSTLAEKTSLLSLVYQR